MPSFSVPNPCAQSWAQMTPAAQGRYCAACEKVVVDFSQMSEAELVGFFAARPSERVCGRFRPEQLSPPQPAPAPLKPSTSWATWLASVAVVLSSCETAPTVVEMLYPTPTDSTTEFFTVRGHVTDHITHEPLSQARVTCLQDTTHQVQTEVDGSFELLLPMQLLGSKLMVVANDGNYSARTITATPKLDTSLLPLHSVVDETSVVGDTTLLPKVVTTVLGAPTLSD